MRTSVFSPRCPHSGPVLGPQEWPLSVGEGNGFGPGNELTLSPPTHCCNPWIKRVCGKAGSFRLDSLCDRAGYNSSVSLGEVSRAPHTLHALASEPAPHCSFHCMEAAVSALPIPTQRSSSLFYFRPTLRRLRPEDMFETWVRKWQTLSALLDTSTVPMGGVPKLKPSFILPEWMSGGWCL